MTTIELLDTIIGMLGMHPAIDDEENEVLDYVSTVVIDAIERLKEKESES